jgi:hypothetical protein
MEQRHPVYLDGRWSEFGFSNYYLKALEYKLPHAAQALFVLAAIFLVFPGSEPRLLRTQLATLLPAGLLIAVASTIAMQLGIRYILPAIPLLLLFAGQVGRWLDWSKYRLRALLVVAAAIVLPFSARFHPQHLAYFNELAGGPLGGRAHLLDSNLDWGQDLHALKRYLDDHPVHDLGLAYFGMFQPAELGIKYHLPPREPTAGWYAISANLLYGRPYNVCGPDGTYRSADLNEFRWLREFEPVARVGVSIDLFHVTEAQARELRLRSRQW